MSKLLVTFISIIFSTIAFGSTVDFGDGSYGPCNFSTNIVGTTYNCTTLNITGVVAVTGTTKLIIKVIGDATVAGTLSADGAVGDPGSNGAGSIDGGLGGAGGSAGGTCDSINCIGEDGFGSGGGARGTPASSAFDDCEGGGGAGGRFGPTPLPGIGEDGGTACTGGTQGTGGAINPTSYNAETEFEVTFVGGSGGGSGARGDTGPGTFYSGGAGGGGGGAIQISAGGNLTITGTIQVDGGDGGDGHTLSGAGGGGSGGAIFLQSQRDLIVTGTLSVDGGTKGTTANNAHGGNGGVGRIRLDDSDGVIPAGGTYIPSDVSVTFIADGVPEVSLIPTTDFDSSMSCGTIAFLGDDERGPGNGLLIFALGLILMFALGHMFQRFDSRVRT